MFAFSGGPELKFGHQTYQPLFLSQGGSLDVVSCVLLDGRGPAIAAHQAHVFVTDSAVARFAAGGEIANSQTRIERSHLVEFPDALPVRERSNLLVVPLYLSLPLSLSVVLKSDTQTGL
jgi:hypothetical protein